MIASIGPPKSIIAVDVHHCCHTLHTDWMSLADTMGLDYNTYYCLPLYVWSVGYYLFRRSVFDRHTYGTSFLSSVGFGVGRIRVYTR